MPLGKTDFLPGISLSYPLSSLPDLFMILETTSRKAFFEKLAVIDGSGGEGLSIDQYIKIIQIGLKGEKPKITYEETEKLVNQYYDEFGMRALEELIVDAFGDAKLTNKKVTDKRKQLLIEIEDLELKRLEFFVQKKEQALQEAEDQITEKLSELGNREGRKKNQKMIQTTPKQKTQKKTI